MSAVLLGFTIRDHYWVVAGSTTQAWSSAAQAYVAATDKTYQVWLATGRRPTPIASEADLWDVLAAQAPDRLPDAEAKRRRNMGIDALADELGNPATTLGAVLDALVATLNEKAPPGQHINKADVQAKVRGKKT